MTGARDTHAQLLALAQASSGTRIVALHAQGGGTFGATWRGETSAGPVFVKSTTAAQADWLAAEADGVIALQRCAEICVPELLGHGVDERHAVLVLGWLDLGPATGADDARLGEALAALHAHRGPRFGWPRDNFLGATEQRNGWCDDAAEFYLRRRLRPQLALAVQRGFGALLATPGKRLCAGVASLYDDGVRPSLLHGDLWGGNRGVTRDGRPALFDPAVHFGDAQNDIAMSTLFGGFGARFYSAYAAASGEDAERSEARRELHRLYHLLNHLNLFGEGYLAQVQSALSGLLARVGA